MPGVPREDVREPLLEQLVELYEKRTAPSKGSRNSGIVRLDEFPLAAIPEEQLRRAMAPGRLDSLRAEVEEALPGIDTAFDKTHHTVESAVHKLTAEVQNLLKPHSVYRDPRLVERVLAKMAEA